MILLLWISALISVLVITNLIVFILQTPYPQTRRGTILTIFLWLLMIGNAAILATNPIIAFNHKHTTYHMVQP